MTFSGPGLPLSDDGMDAACDALGVTEAKICAVLTVEARGFGFLPDRRPQILFERHIFHRRTDGQFDAEDPQISHPERGGHQGGAAEYDRLHRALDLAPTPALESASWGIAQIMGFNHEAVGFDTAEAMVEAFVRDEDAQLEGMARFIEANSLGPALQRGNWVVFARRYSGPDFKANEYDTRLAAAYAKARTVLPDLTLRAAQAGLLYLGINPGPIDGLRGRRTRGALTAYQQQRDLPVTGTLDAGTKAHLFAEAFPEGD
jgi:hypothetical protein